MNAMHLQATLSFHCDAGLHGKGGGDIYKVSSPHFALLLDRLCMPTAQACLLSIFLLHPSKILVYADGCGGHYCREGAGIAWFRSMRTATR